jgi:hypothetical protein
MISGSLRSFVISGVVAMSSTSAFSSEPGKQREVTGRYLEARDVIAIQNEPIDGAQGRYDWGPSVMYDEGVYKMWWVRWGGANRKRFAYQTVLPDGEPYEFTYPDRGDRVYYAESRDGVNWNIEGEDYQGGKADYGPDSNGGLMVLEPAHTEHEYYHVGTPSVIRVNGVYYMYYETCGEFIVTRAEDGNIRVGNEYQNQVFLATSSDGKTWTKHPNNEHPQPIIRAPVENKQPGRQRYGLGQPSVFYRNGRFVMHYVDSCTGPGDFIVRIEADNPLFRNATKFPATLQAESGGQGIPAGSAARFAQTDVKYLGDTFYLVRPAYGTGNLGILTSQSGVFDSDANASHPRDVFPQLRIADPLGPEWKERLFPGFLTDPAGQILVEDGMVTIYFSSGLGWKEKAYSWDLRRCTVGNRQLAALVGRGLE